MFGAGLQKVRLIEQDRDLGGWALAGGSSLASLHTAGPNFDWPPTCSIQYVESQVRKNRLFKYLGCLCALSVFSATAEPVTVRHLEGFIHGFLVLKDLNDKVLGSGELTQISSGNRLTATLSLHLKDGSLYQEMSVFSQQRVYKLLSYKQVMKGPAFKTPQTLTIDANGSVSVTAADKDGKEKTITKQLSIPPDLANGIVTTLLVDVDPNVETTLSMLVATPEPRMVKLKISSTGADTFSIGGSPNKATHYMVKIDLGPITGTVAKVMGKQPPPTEIWMAAGNAPIFLKSEGQMFQDGPIWRIEQASPVWPATRTGNKSD
jgi:hypothetical protein